mmetsp:Transcript_213/g.371  ORF Transcript_213/g.371 Transcript_213/m.371 type:complete len:228 (+) Transcript_213:549-1232(+)
MRSDEQDAYPSSTPPSSKKRSVVLVFLMPRQRHFFSLPDRTEPQSDDPQRDDPGCNDAKSRARDCGAGARSCHVQHRNRFRTVDRKLRPGGSLRASSCSSTERRLMGCTCSVATSTLKFTTASLGDAVTVADSATAELSAVAPRTRTIELLDSSALPTRSRLDFFTKAKQFKTPAIPWPTEDCSSTAAGSLGASGASNARSILRLSWMRYTVQGRGCLDLSLSSSES